MESVLESTVREGDESMTKVPKITLRCIDDVEGFTPFVDWLHHHMKERDPISANSACFACVRCHKEFPFKDGGTDISFKVDDNGWNLYVKPIGDKSEFPMCKQCFREALNEFGMNKNRIDLVCQNLGKLP